jgi:hypothetical protein
MLALGKSAVLASMVLGSCLNPLAAQEASPDVAFVETITGRAVTRFWETNSARPVGCYYKSDQG